MNKQQREIQQLEAEKRKQIEKMLINSNRVFSQEQLSLVSNTFYNNTDLLLTLRKFLLQGILTGNDLSHISEIGSNEQLMSVIRLSLIPVIDPNAAYSSDIWLDIKTEEKGAGEAFNDILSKLVLIRYFEQQIDKMEGKSPKYKYIVKGSGNQWENGEIMFQELTPTGNEGYDGSFINLQARNNIIERVNGTLNQLNMFAIQHHQPLTEEEELEKKNLDSNK